MEGLDIELAQAVARAIFGRSTGHIAFTAISTAQRDAAIEDGAVDLVASAFSITCARKQRMHFSSVYHLAQQKLLVLADSTVDSLADLRGQPVCATNSSTSIGNLVGTGVVPHPVELRPDCLVALQEGRVAAISADDSILFGFRKQDRQTKIRGGLHQRRALRHGDQSRATRSSWASSTACSRASARTGSRASASAGCAACARRRARRSAAATGCAGRSPRDRLRQAQRMILGRRRWRGRLIAPAIARLHHCDRECVREASP